MSWFVFLEGLISPTLAFSLAMHSLACAAVYYGVEIPPAKNLISVEVSLTVGTAPMVSQSETPRHSRAAPAKIFVRQPSSVEIAAAGVAAAAPGSPALSTQISRDGELANFPVAGEGFDLASVIAIPTPDYPARCRRHAIEGELEFRAIYLDGHLQKMEVLKSVEDCPEFVELAAQAVRDGRIVTADYFAGRQVGVRVPFHFQLLAR